MFTLLVFLLELVVEFIALACIAVVILIIPLAILYLIVKKLAKK